MGFRLSHCLIGVLIVALTLGLVTDHVRQQRQIQLLCNAIDHSRDTLRTIEYGSANLQLLELNPAIWEDRDCLLYLKHELAHSIIDYWRSQEEIDDLTKTPGFAEDFAARALIFLDCESVDEFVSASETELSIYPDDGLRHAIVELTDAELESLDTFIRSATAMNDHNSG